MLEGAPSGNLFISSQISVYKNVINVGVKKYSLILRSRPTEKKK